MQLKVLLDFSRNSSWSAASDLRRKAAGRWTDPVRLQHSEGVDPPLGAPPAWWCQEAQEEELHDSQKEQAQAQESQVGCSQVLQGNELNSRSIPVFTDDYLRTTNEFDD